MSIYNLGGEKKFLTCFLQLPNLFSGLCDVAFMSLVQGRAQAGFLFENLVLCLTSPTDATS